MIIEILQDAMLHRHSKNPMDGLYHLPVFIVYQGISFAAASLPVLPMRWI